MFSNHIEKIQEYVEKFELEFMLLWSKCHCKWFFPQYRQKKIRQKLYEKKRFELFNLLSETMDETLPEALKENINNFAIIFSKELLK